MPIRHIEQKVECVRGLLGKRNRDEIGSAFPKHFGGDGCWGNAHAVRSDTKTGTHLLPPDQPDALVNNR
jgi:hypothetical protein